MELSKIEEVLERYFEGKTSITEEKALKHSFSTKKLPVHLEQYKDMFQYFSEEQNKILEVQTQLPKTKSHVYTWVAVAASIVFLSGLFWTYSPNKNQEGLGTYEDPEVALHETKKILKMVSRIMNEGKHDLRYLQEFENAKKNLKYLNSFQEVTNKLVK